MKENIGGAASFDGGCVLSARNVYTKFERKGQYMAKSANFSRFSSVK
jgi:hypothetical protein